MKKFLSATVAVLLSLTAISCKKQANSAEESSNIIQQSAVDSSATIAKSTSENPSKQKDSEKKNSSGVDFDLSAMNYNMVSSITFDMLITPEKYIGKSIKCKGNFHSSVYEGKRYFSVITWDPTGCCPAGLDFEPPENMSFPEDFPEIDNDITVYGKMQLVQTDEGPYLVFQAERIEA